MKRDKRSTPTCLAALMVAVAIIGCGTDHGEGNGSTGGNGVIIGVFPIPHEHQLGLS